MAVRSVRGVRLAVLQHIADTCGPATMTTAEIWEEYLKPIVTRAEKTHRQGTSIPSYLDLLDEAHVGPATVWVSHAWTTPFADTLDCVTQHHHYFMMTYSNSPEPYYWIDLVCSRGRHLVEEQSDEEITWDYGAMVEKMRSIGALLLVLSPWNSPDAVSDLQCLLEVYSCLCVSGQLSVAIPTSQHAVFLEGHHGLPQNAQILLHVMSNIDIIQARAVSETERAIVVYGAHSLIPGSLTTVEDMVAGFLQGWAATLWIDLPANSSAHAIQNHVARSLVGLGMRNQALQHYAWTIMLQTIWQTYMSTFFDMELCCLNTALVTERENQLAPDFCTGMAIVQDHHKKMVAALFSSEPGAERGGLRRHTTSEFEAVLVEQTTDLFLRLDPIFPNDMQLERPDSASDHPGSIRSL